MQNDAPSDMLWRSSSIDQWRGGSSSDAINIESDDGLFEYLGDLSENDLNQLRGVVDLSDLLTLKPEVNPPNRAAQFPDTNTLPPFLQQPKQEPGLYPQPTTCPQPSGSLPEMKLTLFHKPRGSGGVWKPVAEGDAIRVTKDKGKRLRLRIECNFDFDWNEIDISLIDLVSYLDCRQDFSLDLSKSNIKATSAEIELNLTRICKKLQFAVVLKSKHGWTCNGRTIAFVGHNNGKERSTALLKQETSISHEPSPTSSPMPSPGTVTTPPQSLWPQPFGAPSPTEYLQAQSAGKKRKVDSEGSTDEPRAEHITTIPGPLNVQGVVRATGFIQYSDLRLKTNVQDLVDALRMVQDLQAKTYFWKTPSNENGHEEEAEAPTGGKRVIGLIAQEVQKVVPEVVHEDPETGLLSVSYTELIPVLIEALKQHLESYSKDKDAFRKELDELKEQMQSLSIGKNTTEGADSWDNSILERVTARTRNFTEPMTTEEVQMLTRWAEQYNIRLGHTIRRNIRMAKKMEKERKSTHGEERRGKNKPGKHRKDQEDGPEPGDEGALKKKFEHELMLDPIKSQSAVLRFGSRMLALASKRNSKLVVVLFWRRGHLEDLDLHLYREEGYVPTFRVAKENKGQRRKIIGVIGTDTDESYHGTYKVLVELSGEANTYQLQQAKAVVAVFDFRFAGVMPLWMMATSACGDIGHYWVVGSFVVDRSILQWQTMPNTVVSKLPPDWANCATQELSHSDPLPGGDLTRNQDTMRRSSPSLLHTTTTSGQEPKMGRGAPPPPRRVFLRSYHGAYLSASPDGQVFCSRPRQEGPDPPVPHFAETWDIEFDRHGAASLRSYYGRYLSAAPSSSVSLSASKEFPGTDGREVFFPLVDDRMHTLGLISCDGLYVYSNAEDRLVGSPTLPSISTPAPQAPSEAPMKGSVEFYRVMSEGCKAFLEQNDKDGRDVLSSSYEFYQHLSRGAVDLPLVEDNEKVDMNGTFEFYKHLSDGATKEAENAQKEKKGPAPQTDPSLVNFHLPNEEEKWLLEVAPSREAQQAQLAQDMYQKAQHLRMIYSLHTAIERKV